MGEGFGVIAVLVLVHGFLVVLCGCGVCGRRVGECGQEGILSPARTSSAASAASSSFSTSARFSMGDLSFGRRWAGRDRYEGKVVITWAGRVAVDLAMHRVFPRTPFFPACIPWGVT